jgi:hypothetical protein
MTTAKFQIPKPGTTITLTTRYPDYYYYSTSKWKDTTYENVEVLPSEKWLSSSQFMITSDDARMPYRIIEISNVVELSTGEKSTADNSVHTILVPGSNGNVYHVVIEGQHVKSCNCPAFTFRKTCKHVKLVQQMLTSQ